MPDARGPHMAPYTCSWRVSDRSMLGINVLHNIVLFLNGRKLDFHVVFPFLAAKLRLICQYLAQFWCSWLNCIGFSLRNTKIACFSHKLHSISLSFAAQAVYAPVVLQLLFNTMRTLSVTSVAFFDQISIFWYDMFWSNHSIVSYDCQTWLYNTIETMSTNWVSSFRSSNLHSFLHTCPLSIKTISL